MIPLSSFWSPRLWKLRSASHFDHVTMCDKEHIPHFQMSEVAKHWTSTVIICLNLSEIFPIFHNQAITWLNFSTYFLCPGSSWDQSPSIASFQPGNNLLLWFQTYQSPSNVNVDYSCDVIHWSFSGISNKNSYCYGKL